MNISTGMGFLLNPELVLPALSQLPQSLDALVFVLLLIALLLTRRSSPSVSVDIRPLAAVDANSFFEGEGEKSGDGVDGNIGDIGPGLREDEIERFFPARPFLDPTAPK